MRRGFFLAYNLFMTLSRFLGVVSLIACLCVPLLAQQPAPRIDPKDAQPDPDRAAPVQNDQAPAPEQPNTEDKKKQSKLKRKLKDAAPGCIGFSGGAAKCRHSKEDDEEREKEAADQQLRQRCKAAADEAKPTDEACADLRKRDAAHDVEVGDNYLDQKSYSAAAMRYRDALKGDPTNATAMLHLAQVLEKSGHNSEAYEQYQSFLNTDPQGPDARRAREALDRLRPYWTGSSGSK